KTYGFAETMYADYLKLFSDSKYAYEMRFQLADLYYKLEKFDLAAAAYEATVLADPKGKYVADAANDNILAIEEHLKDLKVRRPKLKGAQPIALHPQKQRLVDACDRYAKFVSSKSSERLVAIKYKAGKVMYDYNQHDEALARLDAIVVAHPRSSQAEFAANLVVDIHNLREDWQGLYDSSSKYTKSRPLLKGRDKLSTELAQFADYAKFKLVQRLEKRVEADDGDVTEVGAAYEAFTTEFPKSKNADKALFNASVAYDAAGRVERADQLRRRLLKQYPDSPLVAEVSLYVAKQAAARADYKVAAQAYLKFVDRFGADARARDALYNAAVFYAGVGQVRTANKLRLRYLEEFGRARGGQKEAAEVYWSIARDLERSKRWRSAADRYRDYAKEFPSTDRYWEALWREADIRQRKLRQRKAADKIRAR
ncbi:MAG: tetratricopeptide repeat protein, partial [Myxococcota bacterium]